jgi:gamma-glutamylcyclotransferase (GGCT)/AIG2-like uncharacterized protein YtfP
MNQENNATGRAQSGRTAILWIAQEGTGAANKNNVAVRAQRPHKARRQIMPLNEKIIMFAYGSNMSPRQARQRIPGALILGTAVLPNYKLTERLYADIDFEEGAKVHGVLYMITYAQLLKMDVHEGYPKVYRRLWLEVEFRKESILAVTYEMTAATKTTRNNLPYPEAYRKVCHAGARHYKIKSQFTKKRAL